MKPKDIEFLVDVARLGDTLTQSGLSPVARGNARESALITAVHSLAIKCSITDLGPILRIDARGEILLSSPNGFTEEFCEHINQQGSRTGTSGNARMVSNASSGQGNWCYMGHFQAEAMVRHAAQEMPAEKGFESQEFFLALQRRIDLLERTDPMGRRADHESHSKSLTHLLAESPWILDSDEGCILKADQERFDPSSAPGRG
jgi:hypothetical protein